MTVDTTPTFAQQNPIADTEDPAVDFPEKLQVLFTPSRYKVLYGGRGGAKSWGVARALITIAVSRSIRVLCVRELQKSMEDSVHKLLCDQIEDMGLSGIFEIQKKGIRCLTTGSTFFFEGIKNNASKIKSFEGVDYCWLEEGAKVSKASFTVLTPTIRKPGSEIWITFNPELETDYIYDRFVKNSEPRSIVVKINWRDNPWFPEELRLDKERDEERDPDLALNVWEGHTVKHLEGAVYAKELREVERSGRITVVPWDRSTPVNTYWDLGRGDATAIWFAQRVGMENRVLAYYQESGEDITHFLKELQRREYVYGDHYLPHDGAAKRLGSRLTIQETIAAKYPRRVHIVPKQSVLDGINAARLFLGGCWFDQEECVDGLNALRNYRYRVIDGQRSNLPLHDWASDGADAFRYMALSFKHSKGASGTEVLRKLREPAEASRSAIVGALSAAAHSLGWMG